MTTLSVKRVVVLVAAALTLLGCGTDETGQDALVEVALAYTSSSNYGPEDATGTVRYRAAEHWIEAAVYKLPMEDGEQLQCWLRRGAEAPRSLFYFNTSVDEFGVSSVVLAEVDLTSYDNVFITVEPLPDYDPEPEPRVSIQGTL